MNGIQSIKEELKLYVKQNSFVGEQPLNESTLLFKEGIFDSMGFMTLLAFLQDKYEITSDDTDLVEENFESINAISSFIERKRDKSII